MVLGNGFCCSSVLPVQGMSVCASGLYNVLCHDDLFQCDVCAQ